MAFHHQIEAILTDLRAQGLYRELAPSEGISFIHNDYLALSGHPEIIEAGIWALKVFGSGSRGSRLLGGQSRVFEQVEEAISDFFGSPAALFFSSGFLANSSLVQTLAPLSQVILSDEKNHASLIDPIRLSAVPYEVIPHGKWRQFVSNSHQRQLVISESLFSMDGDVMDSEGLFAVGRDNETFWIFDEAHAAGVFSQTGRGLLEGTPLDWNQVAVTVTFGKAFGVAGAAVLCSKAVKELLINRGRSFIYTTAPSPAVPAMVTAALKVASQATAQRKELWERAVTVRKILAPCGQLVKPKGDSIWNERSPIIAFLIPGEDNALRFCKNMRKSGIELRAIRYPTIPRGQERIRISLSLHISRENTEAMAQELLRQWTIS